MKHVFARREDGKSGVKRLFDVITLEDLISCLGKQNSGLLEAWARGAARIYIIRSAKDRGKRQVRIPSGGRGRRERDAELL